MSGIIPLEIRSLSKNYGALKAVDQVSFEVKPGEVFGLLGPNGAGKTSIISIVTTLEKPTGGEAFLFGQDVTAGRREVKKLLGTVSQEVVNHGFFDVEEILQFHSGYYGIWNNKERINFLIERLGLRPHRKKKVKQLSGGMKRRLMIAKALVHSPKLLLLDEPTAGVDIELRASLWDFVRELQKDGLSILLTTHYLEEAEELCNRVGIINQGQLKLVGETQSIIKKLTHREICIEFENTPPEVNHPQMTAKGPHSLTFIIPATAGVGELMQALDLPLTQVVDIKIKEGSLEDVFMHVLGEEV